MITVCKYHVKEGLSILHTPHISKTTLNIKCRYCNKLAHYELELNCYKTNRCSQVKETVSI